MQAASLGEGFLRLAQSRWQSRQDLGRNGQIGFHWREMLMHCFDGGFAADAATRRGENMPRERLEIYLDGRGQEDVQGIFRSVAFQARGDFDDLVTVIDQSFA